MENPKYIFHYKLINTFSQEILEKIFLIHFENYPILNMSKLKNHIFQDDFSTLFIPKYIKNFYMNIIVSVNSKKNDFAVIEDIYDGTITKEKFLNKINLL
ncbi:hypothetical protein ACOL23_00720 [Aliarcobacter butzleri]|uniref:hypothetical protein n=1 Tax=Aliarcobacter butzleri TaxID=28197 RepID=UPI0021B4CC08|nr:hypothetical protein [Aliarcobacter butzleri]MCT7572805.1 hypothetical protein [Aliarcobacter butzleri]